MKSDAQVYAGATALGIVAGMRAMSAPALITQVARRGDLAVEGSRLGFLNSKGTVAATALLAAGELVADKLPKIPNRTAAGPLVTRALIGAVSGAVVCSAKKRSPWLGALYGAMGAIGAAFAAYHLRRSLKKSLRVPDPVLAVAEDALVTSGSWLLAAQLAENDV